VHLGNAIDPDRGSGVEPLASRGQLKRCESGWFAALKAPRAGE